MPDNDRLAAAEARIGHVFRDRALLVEALTHGSSTSGKEQSNERLEFLGDSILGAIIARHLFQEHPDWDEGELTRVKSAVVSAAALAEASRVLGLSEFCVVGKSLGREGRLPASLLANLFEAVVAALFLDGGPPAAERFVLQSLTPQIDNVVCAGLSRNWKSLLQHHAQKRFGRTPTYRVVSETGPDHGKRFIVVAMVGETELGRGEGASKKEAEQAAAETTLRALDVSDPPPVLEVMPGTFEEPETIEKPLLEPRGERPDAPGNTGAESTRN